MTNQPKVTPKGSEKISYKKTKKKYVEPKKDPRDLILTHKEAQAGSPDDMAACGEEDIGAGLEFLVTRDNHNK